MAQRIRVMMVSMVSALPGRRLSPRPYGGQGYGNDQGGADECSQRRQLDGTDAEYLSLGDCRCGQKAHDEADAEEHDATRHRQLMSGREIDQSAAERTHCRRAIETGPHPGKSGTYPCSRNDCCAARLGHGNSRMQKAPHNGEAQMKTAAYPRAEAAVIYVVLSSGRRTTSWGNHRESRTFRQATSFKVSSVIATGRSEERRV